MLLTVLAACAFGSMLLWAAVVLPAPALRRRSEARQRAVAACPPQDRPTRAAREEDRIRPVVDRTGARIWVAEQDLLWHEIVHWPARRTAGEISPSVVSDR